MGNKVKVPALPRVLLENKALVAKYLVHKEEDEGATTDVVVSRAASDDQLSRPTAKPEFNISDSALKKYHFDIVILSSSFNNEVVQRKSELQQSFYKGPKQTEEKDSVRQPCLILPQETQRQEATNKYQLENMLEPLHQQLCDPRLSREHKRDPMKTFLRCKPRLTREPLISLPQVARRHVLHVFEDLRRKCAIDSRGSTSALHENVSLEYASQKDCSKVGSRQNSSQNANSIPHHHLCEKARISSDSVATACSSTQCSTVTR